MVPDSEVFLNVLQLASKLHHHNTRYATKTNLTRPPARTDYGKMTAFRFSASQIWENIPTS
jgi:hypothetical protein